MMARTSLVLTVALALGAPSPARAQLARSCRYLPFQQALSVEVVPTSDWVRTTQTATYTVPTWAVFEIEAVSARASAPAEGAMYVHALSLSTQVGGIRATHFNTPPVPPPTMIPGGGREGGFLFASPDAATSSTTALYAGPGSEVRVSADALLWGETNGRVEWTLSGHLVTANGGCPRAR